MKETDPPPPLQPFQARHVGSFAGETWPAAVDYLRSKQYLRMAKAVAISWLIDHDWWTVVGC